MATPVLTSAVQQVLDLPAHRLAAVIGTWPQPAILASGPGFGAAGSTSIFAAYPRLVYEARDKQWTRQTDSGVYETGSGEPLAELARLCRQYSLGEPGNTPEDESCPFQGGLIGL